MGKKESENFFSYTFRNAAYAVLSFISIPIITHIISKKEFGKYSMYLLGYFIVLNFSIMGLDQGLIRFCHDGSDGKRKVLFFKVFKLIFLHFMLIISIFFLFREKISIFLFEEYRLIKIILLTVSIFLGIIFYLQNMMLRINGKSFQYVFIQILNQLIFIISSIVFTVFIKKDFIFIVLGQILSFSISIAFGIYFDRKFWFAKKDNFKNSGIKEIFLYSIPYLPVISSLWIMISSDRFFIKYFYGLEDAGVYSVANKIISIFSFLQGGFSLYWLPVIYEHYWDKRNDKEYFKNTFEKAEFIFFAAMIIFIILKDFILLLFGTEYQEASFYIPFLLFIPVMQMLAQISGIGIDIEKRCCLNIISILFALLINLIGNYFFTRILGAKGASISTGVSFVIYFILKTVIAKKVFPVQINFIKVFFSLAAVFLFSILTTFYKSGLFSIGSGIIFLSVILFIHKRNVFEFIEKFKNF